MTNVNNFAIIGYLTADAEEFNIGNNTYSKIIITTPGLFFLKGSGIIFKECTKNG